MVKCVLHRNKAPSCFSKGSKVSVVQKSLYIFINQLAQTSILMEDLILQDIIFFSLTPTQNNQLSLLLHFTFFLLC